MKDQLNISFHKNYRKDKCREEHNETSIDPAHDRNYTNNVH